MMTTMPIHLLTAMIPIVMIINHASLPKVTAIIILMMMPMAPSIATIPIAPIHPHAPLVWNCNAAMDWTTTMMVLPTAKIQIVGFTAPATIKPAVQEKPAKFSQIHLIVTQEQKNILLLHPARSREYRANAFFAVNFCVETLKTTITTESLIVMIPIAKVIMHANRMILSSSAMTLWTTTVMEQLIAATKIVMQALTAQENQRNHSAAMVWMMMGMGNLTAAILIAQATSVA